MKKSDIRRIIKEEADKLYLESQASDEAKKKGLEYMSFGRWGKDGKVTHKSDGGKLVPISPTEKAMGSAAPAKRIQTKQPKPIKHLNGKSVEPALLKQRDKLIKKYEKAGLVTQKALEVAKIAKQKYLTGKIRHPDLAQKEQLLKRAAIVLQKASRDVYDFDQSYTIDSEWGNRSKRDTKYRNLYQYAV